MQDPTEHTGSLAKLRTTNVFTATCSCGFSGHMNDKGRARAELAAHLTQATGLSTDARDVPTLIQSVKRNQL